MNSRTAFPALVLACTLIACGGGAGLSGTYRMGPHQTELESSLARLAIDLEMVFSEDGTVITNMDVLGEEVHYIGTYSLVGDQLSVKAGDGTTSRGTVEGDIILLDGTRLEKQ